MSPTPFETSSAAVQASMAAAATMYLIMIPVLIFTIICTWKIFTKAGKPGWASIVPIYNIIVQLEIVGKPAWWIVFLFIPPVNIVIAIILTIEFGKVFGKSVGWSILLLMLFSPIGYAILAFGNDQYIPPAGTNGTTGMTPPTPPTDVNMPTGI